VKRVLGVSVGASTVRAVLIERGAVRWAGTAEYVDLDELADAIARLAGEAGAPVRRARVVLERDVVQLRSIVPAPPLKATALRRYVALEAARLFRKNGAPLVTDAMRIPLTKTTAALWAGAAAEPLVQAAFTGCTQAGLTVEVLGPAADVLACAVVTADGPIAFSNGGTTELLELGIDGVCQSRKVRNGVPVDGQPPSREFTRALASLGDQASHFAGAYGAATALPRLSLLPAEARAAQERHSRHRMIKLVALGTALWLLAGGTYVGRLAWTRHVATRSLGALATTIDSALAQRRELGLADATLRAASQAEHRRSRHLALLAAVTRALGDSTYLVAVQVTPEGVVRLAGYAPVAARVVADLERTGALRDVRLEGPVTREAGSGMRDARDRFAIVARLEQVP
jgi:hypothetical protein